MGGHLGLRLCWLWLELGFGKLPVTAAAAAVATHTAGLAALATTAALPATVALPAAAEPFAADWCRLDPPHMHSALFCRLLA